MWLTNLSCHARKAHLKIQNPLCIGKTGLPLHITFSRESPHASRRRWTLPSPPTPPNLGPFVRDRHTSQGRDRGPFATCLRCECAMRPFRLSTSSAGATNHDNHVRRTSYPPHMRLSSGEAYIHVPKLGVICSRPTPACMAQWTSCVPALAVPDVASMVLMRTSWKRFIAAVSG